MSPQQSSRQPAPCSVPYARAFSSSKFISNGVRLNASSQISTSFFCTSNAGM